MLLARGIEQTKCTFFAAYAETMYVKLKSKSTMKFAKGVIGLLLVVVFMLPSSEAKGQLYFTGAIGAGVASASTKSVVTVGSSSATDIKSEIKGLSQFFPEAAGGLKASVAVNVGVGYMFSTRLGAGASFGYHMLRRGSITKATYNDPYNDYMAKETSNTTVHTFTLQPYFRVVPVSVVGFTVYFDCGVPLEFGSVSESFKNVDRNSKSEGKENLGSVVQAGVGLTPGVMYSFTDHISLFANLRFLNLGYTYTQYRPSSDGEGQLLPIATKMTERYHQFNLGKLSEGLELGLRITL